MSPDADDAPVDGEGGVVAPGQRHDLPDVEDLPQRVGLGVVEGGALVPAWVVELSTALREISHCPEKALAQLWKLWNFSAHVAPTFNLVSSIAEQSVPTCAHIYSFGHLQDI